MKLAVTHSRQAIQVKFLAPTNTKGTRLKAFSYGSSVTVDYNYGICEKYSVLNVNDANAWEAAQALIKKLDWGNETWTMGSLKNGDYVFSAVGGC